MRRLFLCAVFVVGCGGDDDGAAPDAGQIDASSIDAPLALVCDPLTGDSSGGGGVNANFVTPVAITEAYQGGRWRVDAGRTG